MPLLDQRAYAAWCRTYRSPSIVRTADLPGLASTVMDVAEAYPDPAADGLVVQLVLVGDGQRVCGNLGAGRFRLPAVRGSAVVVPPGVPPDFQGIGPFRVAILHLAPELIQEWTPIRWDFEEVGPLQANAFFDPEVARLVRALTVGTSSPEVQVEALLGQLAVRSKRLTSFPEPGRRVDPARVERLIEYLWANLDRPVTPVEAARVIGLGKYELSCVFTATMGQSMASYHARLRATHRREAEAAEAVILSDVKSLPEESLQ
ncbi:MAG: hypothetical protein AAGF12_36420 [Myxococcota bacterium]